MASIGNIVNFFVTWFDASDDYSTTADFTDDVIGISFTDTGSGKVNECILKLSGAFGNLITDTTLLRPCDLHLCDPYGRDPCDRHHRRSRRG